MRGLPPDPLTVWPADPRPVVVWRPGLGGLLLAAICGALVVALLWATTSLAASPTIVASPRPTEPPDSAPGTFGGTATWYCSSSSPCTRGYGPQDLVAAIDPTLGIPKGARLRVHHGTASVVVVIVDVCQCKGERVIDLTSGAFARLAPLSAGVIPVAIEVAGDLTLPPTDLE